MTDETILLRAREGHEDAFRQIYDNHREPIYRLAYRYTRSQEDAEDMMQETFIKAFRAIKTFKNNDSRDIDPDANLEMGGFSI